MEIGALNLEKYFTWITLVLVLDVLLETLKAHESTRSFADPNFEKGIDIGEVLVTKCVSLHASK